jgi:hypothetical protein
MASSCFSRDRWRLSGLEIERLEKALKECTDGGIPDRIKAWIKGRKKEIEGR